MYVLLIIILILPCSIAVPLTIYENARFESNRPSLFSTNLSELVSRDQCLCLCYFHRWCLMATYSGFYQQCALSSARPEDGQMYLEFSIKKSSVFYFVNKTLPCK